MESIPSLQPHNQFSGGENSFWESGYNPLESTWAFCPILKIVTFLHAGRVVPSVSD